MKRLFSANAPADEATLRMLKAALEDDGIACMIRNEQLTIGKGDIPCTECIPELWVLEDRDYLRAKKIMDDWKESNLATPSAWVCPTCKETLEGQFTSCWKCGKDRVPG